MARQLSLLAVIAVTTALQGRAEQARAFREDFEQGIKGWTTENHGNYLSLAVVQRGKQPGFTFKVSLEKARTNKTDTAFQLRSPRFDVTAGQVYLLKFDSRHNVNLTRAGPYGEGKSWANCVIWYDRQGQEIAFRRIKGFDASTETWHLDRRLFRAPGGATSARLQFGADAPEFSTGDYWCIDSVSFVPIR